MSRFFSWSYPTFCLPAALLFTLAAVASPPPSGPAAALVLPVGTPIRMQLETALSSGNNRAGDSFAGRVMQSVYLRGTPAIPAGSIVEGHVAMVQDARPALGRSELLLRPDYLTLPDGRHYVISANLTQTNAPTGIRVDSEGIVEASRGPDAQDAHRALTAGGSGLIAGTVLVGAKGALIGGGLGAAVAGGWWLLSHRHAELNPGAEVDVVLDRPVALSAATLASPAVTPGTPPMSPLAPSRSSSSPVAAAIPAQTAPAASFAPSASATPKPTVQDIPAPGSPSGPPHS